jgi:hypothetical protein
MTKILLKFNFNGKKTLKNANNYWNAKMTSNKKI